MSKKEPKPKADRHKPSRMLRVRQRIADQLVKLAKQNDSDFTEEGNRLIREGLERLGLWSSSGSKED